MSTVHADPPRRPRGRLRRLAAPFVAPAVFDFWAGKLHPSWTWERPLARIVSRSRAADDAVTLVLAPNRHWRGHAAGQHVNLSAEIDGVRVTRSYSLDDVPRADRRISVTVKAIAGGRMSRYLHDDARVGQVLGIGPAFGDMVLPLADDAPWLLVAGGSGITPLMAQVRALAARGMPVATTLVYSVRTLAAACYLDELRALAARFPRFELRLVLTRDDAVAADAHAGRVDGALLAAWVPDLAARHVHACGPGAFVAAVTAALDGCVARLATEAFTPPPRPGDAAVETGDVAVTLAHSGRTLHLPRGTALLPALEAEGLRPKHGCRMGICNTCACGKAAGATRDLRTGTANAEPVAALKLCVSSAVSDLVLDL